MTKDQYKRTGRIVLPNLLICFGAIMMTVVANILRGNTKGLVSIIVQLTVMAIALILIFVSYFKLRDRRLGMIGFMLSGSLMYLLICTVGTSAFSFIYGFVVLFLAMTYLNRRLVIEGNVVIAIGYVTHILKMTRLGQADAQNFALGGVIIVLCGLTSVMVINLLLKFNQESVAIIEEKVKQQKETNELLVDTAEKIVTSVTDTDQLLQELNQAIQTSDTSMKDIAQSTYATATAVQEQAQMCGDIQKESDSAKERIENMTSASEQAGKTVEEGAQLIQSLKAQARIVEDANRETVEATKALSAKVQNVKDITDAILSISSQTNLLALNASIEAARAGEAGKGFAVVADEIRKLSEGTRESANQITAIIEQLIEDANSTGESVEKSSESILLQNEMIEQAKSKFDGIETQVQALVGDIEDTERVIGQILDATSSINDNVSQLSANSEEVAATTENGVAISQRAVENLQLVNEEIEKVLVLANRLKEV